MFQKAAILVLPLVMAVGSCSRAAEGDGTQDGQVEIKPGDVVEVVSDRAKFQSGRNVVATLEKGRQLNVRRVQDGWIGGRLNIGGAEREGWIRQEDLKRIKAATPEELVLTPPVVEPERTTEETLAAEPRPLDAVQTAATTPAITVSGFARVAGNALATNANFTIEVLMASNDKAVAEIKPSEKIGTLVLVGKGVTSKALKNLGGLKVRMLNIDGTRISNSGLQYLADIEGLRVLRLWSADLTDTALARVKQVASLEALDLEGANVGGPGLAHLKGLENLRALVLGPGIEDAELAHLGDLPQLEELDLRACRQITDAGLAHLVRPKNLQRIAFPPQITREAQQSLGQQLPGCEFFQ